MTAPRPPSPSAWPAGLALWRAGRVDVPDTVTLSSGWPALDAELPGGGWPLAGLTELLLPPASGELALLAPWLRALGARVHGPHALAWIAPPAQPCVAALQACGLAAAQLVCVTPTRLADAAWAAEQALRSQSCAAVLWWVPDPMPSALLRRLHLAAQAGATPLIALRAPAERRHGSPAPLRAACSPQPGYRLSVEVFKRRGPPMAAPLQIALPPPVSVRPLSPRPASNAVDRPLPAPAAPAGTALV